MAIQNTVLIGNGPNRTVTKDCFDKGKYEISWKSLLEKLAAIALVNIRDIDTKPLTLVFDEILLRSKVPNIKSLILNQVERELFYARNSELAETLNSLSNSIMTTNYHWPPATPVSMGRFLGINEKNFSLFRCNAYKEKSLWYINGWVLEPSSIAIGYRQYARYQAQIKTYLHSGISYSKLKVKNSPLYRGIPNFEFEKSEPYYSWVDLFLRDHIHMIGLGMEYTESILWWLLIEKFALKQRYPKYIGGLTYHHVDVKNKLEINVDGKLHMLEDLGVHVNRVSASNYFDGYMKIARQINPKLPKK
jgi:hypothetical protein